MKQRITLHELMIEASLGIYPHERCIRAFPLTLELSYDASAAILADDVAHAVNYERVADVAREVARAHHFNLVETLLEAIGSAVIALPHVLEVKAKLAKPGAIEGAANVWVEGEWEK